MPNPCQMLSSTSFKYKDSVTLPNTRKKKPKTTITIMGIMVAIILAAFSFTSMVINFILASAKALVLFFIALNKIKKILGCTFS